MANALYPKFKENLLKGNIDFDTATVKAVLVDLADYTYSSAHDALDDVASGARVSTATLGSITTTNGTVDSADATFSAVTGDVSEAVIVYVDSGVESTSYLVAFYDTGVTGLPVTPNGGDITLTVNASGLFAL